ncbi:UNVERIFIED_CONTAM: hypothetical protein K2H54_056484 [Gekko kuhli]
MLSKEIGDVIYLHAMKSFSWPFFQMKPLFFSSVSLQYTLHHDITALGMLANVVKNPTEEEDPPHGNQGVQHTTTFHSDSRFVIVAGLRDM